MSKHGIPIQKQNQKEQFQSAHLSNDCRVNSEMESMGLSPHRMIGFSCPSICSRPPHSGGGYLGRRT